ncbi:hypothetical protein HC723_00630 [Vibrio sp. S11_S32]|uniref:hypothetical protein n=1 Tax=Vibrio sp. S11_S32 TaxID=2720225 RepID=UPI0016807213|nr:hypothetical protein [Vibrio sp. S11_S32]MBD1574976.1 hypothetical protein [Vibrio sp. S11_S32]
MTVKARSRIFFAYAHVRDDEIGFGLYQLHKCNDRAKLSTEKSDQGRGSVFSAYSITQWN